MLINTVHRVKFLELFTSTFDLGSLEIFGLPFPNFRHRIPGSFIGNEPDPQDENVQRCSQGLRDLEILRDAQRVVDCMDSLLLLAASK